VEVVAAESGDPVAWSAAMAGATLAFLAGGRGAK
jgi:hypothetical protein